MPWGMHLVIPIVRPCMTSATKLVTTNKIILVLFMRHISVPRLINFYLWYAFLFVHNGNVKCKLRRVRVVCCEIQVESLELVTKG